MDKDRTCPIGRKQPQELGSEPSTGNPTHCWKLGARCQGWLALLALSQGWTGESEGQAWSCFGIISQESQGYPTKELDSTLRREKTAQWVCPWGDICAWGSECLVPRAGGGLGKRDPGQGDQTRDDSTSSGSGVHSPGLGRRGEKAKEVRDRDTAQKIRASGGGLEICLFLTFIERLLYSRGFFTDHFIDSSNSPEIRETVVPKTQVREAGLRKRQPSAPGRQDPGWTSQNLCSSGS